MDKQKAFRSALGSFVTGVTVVTAVGPDGERVGITANSFTSVSMDPPLVQVNLARSLRSFPTIEKASGFAISLLSREQHELCMRFSRPANEKWLGLEEEISPEGMPLIPGRLGHFDCKTWARYDGGDHLILVGEVTSHHIRDGAEPLIFYKGALQAFGLVQHTS